jgi:hypothetical protein
MLIAAALYTLHLISYPSGWWTPSSDDVGTASVARVYAAMAANGSVGVMLANKSMHQVGAGQWRLDENSPQRILVVRSNGTSTILKSPMGVVTIPNFPNAHDCLSGDRPCAQFAKVAMAADGTPFVTFSTYFIGAYSGLREATLIWNGSWHVVRKQDVFQGLSQPKDTDIRNLSIASADTAESYAFVGDYDDFFPMEDIDQAASDPYYMADVSGATFPWGSVALGIGNATAMRNPFIAGFDGGLKLVSAHGGSPAVALRWRCVRARILAHSCKRRELGTGVAYGVDSSGDAVGDNEPRVASSAMRLHLTGRPVLWRDGSVVRLSDDFGSAYAISGSGIIVGTIGDTATAGAMNSDGFVAHAHDPRPVAISLDGLVRNLDGRHISQAFGVSDDGRILAVVGAFGAKGNAGRLAILTPL